MWLIVFNFLCSIFTFIIPVLSFLQVQYLQTPDSDNSTFGGRPGFNRNFNTQYTPHSVVDTSTTAYFCSEYERQLIQVNPWDRLRTVPGPDDRTLADVLQSGKLLGASPPLSATEKGIPFNIPVQAQVGRLYTIYWMWNTTTEVEGGFLVYTSCFDIEIIETSGDSPTTKGATSDVLSSTALVSTSTPSNLTNDFPTTKRTKSSLLSRTRVVSTSVSSYLTSYIMLNSSAVRRPTFSGSSQLSGETVCPSISGLNINMTSSPSLRSPSIAMTSKADMNSSCSLLQTTTHSKTGMITQSILGGSESTNRPFITPPWQRNSTLPISITGMNLPTSLCSTPRIGSTQTVRVNTGNMTEFDPPSLDLSIGDAVMFYPINGSFNLYNTTLDESCVGVTRLGDDIDGSVLYNVTSSKPAWFLGLQHDDGWYYCFPGSHFALNPGNESEQFSSTIRTTSYMSIARPDRHLSTTTVVVTDTFSGTTLTTSYLTIAEPYARTSTTTLVVTEY
ncbi:hypothetical protein BO94DRAFT_549541 [Aspergillus sclerotioniger CBS 115572]|uniref:Uncharacterized protein n=1 Tax=Aspergillus sclerotioniger CBS 115572 TaxID=1450535 RepID=A0A317VMY1_9EURO|nr:hypothetical protein BO94DRAFT_549541 [Aspergillus sclerotioniger CBS 115572]PWY75285.1 hypothetical protein BO94DRAFT_549541 [Aspergillus sclerotioniger CBS 115572]